MRGLAGTVREISYCLQGMKQVLSQGITLGTVRLAGTVREISRY